MAFKGFDTFIKMTNGGEYSPNELADMLDHMANWLQEHNAVYECDCEDYEEPRGYQEYDTGTYIHGDDCPTWQEGHQQIILKSTARALRNLWPFKL